MHPRDALTLELERHPGARGLVGSRAIQHELARSQHLRLVRIEVLGRDPPAPGNCIRHGGHIEPRAKIDDGDVLTGVEELMRALDDQVRLGKILYPAVSDWAAWQIAEANTAARLRDWSPFTAVQLRYNLLERSPERELLPMADAFDLPVFAWGPLAEGRLTGKYLSGHTGRLTEVGRPYTRVGSDDIVRDVVAISHEIGCSPAQVAISWVRQQPGSVIPLIAARTEEQFRDNLAAIDVHLSQQHLDRLDALSRPTLGFPADVMREASVVGGVYGAQLPDIDDPRAQAVRRTTTGT